MVLADLTRLKVSLQKENERALGGHSIAEISYF